MDGGAQQNRLDRIAAALSRIESAVITRADEAERLQSRHERLKAAIADTLGQLDELIAEQRK